MKIKKIIAYLKGELFCRHAHKPLFYDMPSAGACFDIFGRQGGLLFPMSCVKCGNKWETLRVPRGDKIRSDAMYFLERLNRKYFNEHKQYMPEDFREACFQALVDQAEKWAG